MNPIPFDEKRTYDWLIVSQSYLQTALMGARILSEKVGGLSVSSGDVYGDYSQEPSYLIFPVLFTFKHGIELYLKSIMGIADFEFPKGHDLVALTDRVPSLDSRLKAIIRKYAYSNLFLPRNALSDLQNQFERYPQGTPYDGVDFFWEIDRFGKRIEPPTSSFDDYVDWTIENNIQIAQLVTPEKVKELIDDIEYVFKILRRHSIAVKEAKS